MAFIQLASAAVLIGSLVGAAPTADQGVVPYVDPPFAQSCLVHQFDEGVAPDLAAYPDDPLCVEYAKRNITLDNGGAVAFLLAEPARFALAAGKCSYWQQDHWSIQVSPNTLAVIRWDGSYWFDQGTGRAGGRISHLRIAGQPATLEQAAAFAAPYSADLAAFFLRYGEGGDGGSVNAGFPFNPQCA